LPAKIGCHQIIGIKKYNVVALCQCQPVVSGCSHSGIGLMNGAHSFIDKGIANGCGIIS
jgi:hypothetical protein